MLSCVRRFTWQFFTICWSFIKTELHLVWLFVGLRIPACWNLVRNPRWLPKKCLTNSFPSTPATNGCDVWRADGALWLSNAAVALKTHKITWTGVGLGVTWTWRHLVFLCPACLIRRKRQSIYQLIFLLRHENSSVSVTNISIEFGSTYCAR